MMPGLDGRQVLAGIRAREQQKRSLTNAEAKIVMTTSIKDSKEVLSAFRAGCEGYIVKPIDPAELWLALSKLGIQPPA